MKARAEIVIMSHLSDLQEDQKDFNKRVNFIKFIILQCDGDLNKEINPYELYNEFEKQKTE